MKKAKRDKRNALLATFCFLFFAIAFTAGSFIIFNLAQYVFMLVLCGLSAICYYVFVFCIFRYVDAKAAVNLLYIMGFSGAKEERRMMTLSDISRAMGWNKKSTKRLIEKCKRKGYTDQ